MLNRQLIRRLIILRVLRHAGFQIGHVWQFCRLAQKRQLRFGTGQFGFMLIAFNRIQHRLGFGQFIALGQAATVQNQRFGVGVVFSKNAFEQRFSIGKTALGKQRLRLLQRVCFFGLRHFNVRLQQGAHGGFRQGLLEVLDRLALFKQHHDGQVLNAEVLNQCVFNVAVHLGQQQLTLITLGDFFKDRQDHLARCAPLGPEIHQNRLLERSVDYQLLKIGCGHVEAIRRRRLIHQESRNR